jgi:hypothetical protein
VLTDRPVVASAGSGLSRRSCADGATAEQVERSGRSARPSIGAERGGTAIASGSARHRFNTIVRVMPTGRADVPTSSRSPGTMFPDATGRCVSNASIPAVAISTLTPPWFLLAAEILHFLENDTCCRLRADAEQHDTPQQTH